MIITRLEMFRFKRFKHAQFAFQPGLNVIQGPNEAGKSTLRTALMAVLFGNPTSESVATQAWTTWGEPERCELRLEYRDHQGHTCQLRKDFSEGKIFLVKEQETYRTAKTIQTMIAEELGIPNEEFYMLCSSLDVRSLANLGTAASRKETGKMLASLMSGSGNGQDCGQILKKLDDAVREIGKGLKSPSKVPGPLKAGRDRLTLLTAQRADLERRAAERQSKISEHESLNARLEKAKQRMGELEHLLEANAKLLAAQKRRSELAEQDAQFDRSRELLRKSETELEALRLELERTPAARFSAEQVQELQNLLQQREKLCGTSPCSLPPRPGPIWLAVGFGLLALGIAGAFFAWKLLGLFFLGGIAGLALAWRQREIWRRQEAACRAAMTEWENENAACDNRLRQIMAAAAGISPEDILKSWPQAQKTIARSEALQRQFQNIQPVDETRWQALRSELRIADDVLNDPQSAGLRLEPQNLAERQRERQQLAGQMAEWSEQQASLKAWLRQDTGSIDQLNSVDEEIADLKERLQQWERRERLFRTTFDLLDRARRATLNPAREVLEQAAGGLFRRLSGGRYEKLMVSDEDLSSRIHSQESGKWEDPAVLSQGAFDQFYLSLRLALCDILSAGKHPPLLLDEPFAAFDLERLQSAQALLRELAGQRQIFLFTCRHEYDRIADHLIELEGPGGREELAALFQDELIPTSETRRMRRKS